MQDAWRAVFRHWPREPYYRRAGIPSFQSPARSIASRATVTAASRYPGTEPVPDRFSIQSCADSRYSSAGALRSSRAS